MPLESYKNLLTVKCLRQRELPLGRAALFCEPMLKCEVFIASVGTLRSSDCESALLRAASSLILESPSPGNYLPWEPLP